jgi:hypothetical protein
MRVLCQDEILAVSGGFGEEGGDSSLTGWWKDIFVWIQGHFAASDNAAGGLSQDQARKACQDLGRGLNSVEAGILRKAYPGDEVKQVCQNAVNNVVNWQDKSPAAICEGVDGGTWNTDTRTCDP